MSRGKNSRRTQKNLAKTTVATPEKKVEEKVTAEAVKPTVKETVQPVKKEDVKPVAEKKETVKAEPVKATVKAEEKVQPKETKTAAKAEEKPVAKTTAKEAKATAKTAEKKTTKKTTAKKATAKKPVEKVTEVYFEYNGEQILSEELVSRIQEAYKNEGHRISSIKTLRVYINPDERKAYYVINDKAEGKFVEF